MDVQRWTSPSGKRRWLTTLDATETARFAAATQLALPRRPGGRRSFGSPPGHPGRPWHEERRAWRATVQAAVTGARWVLVGDVADCYPSIRERAIRGASASVAGDPEPLLGFLASLRDGGVRGLPVGPGPSARIADAVLAIADERARAAGVSPIRWVDDVVFAGDRDDVARAARAWRSALVDLGLREHDGKRRAFHDPSLAAATILPRPSLAAPGAHGIMRTS